MFASNDINKKEMTCEKWLKALGTCSREMMVSRLINDDEIKKQVVSESMQTNNHAAYVVEALLCADVKSLDAAKMEKAYEYLKKNKFPENVSKSIEVMLAYLMYRRGAKMINAKVLTEIICAATQGNSPALIVLPKADLHGLDFSVTKNPADLSCANLQDANLSDCNMQKVTFNKANLWNASLVKTNFQGCDMRGVNLADANLLEAKLGRGADGANLADALLLPDIYVFDEGKLNKFLQDSHTLYIPLKVILDVIDRNFMNNQYSYEDKLDLYKKALYHPCFNTKAGVFSISKDALLCKTKMESHIKALKMNIAARDERKRAEALQNTAKK